MSDTNNLNSGSELLLENSGLGRQPCYGSVAWLRSGAAFPASTPKLRNSEIPACGLHPRQFAAGLRPRALSLSSPEGVHPGRDLKRGPRLRAHFNILLDVLRHRKGANGKRRVCREAQGLAGGFPRRCTAGKGMRSRTIIIECNGLVMV